MNSFKSYVLLLVLSVSLADIVASGPVDSSTLVTVASAEKELFSTQPVAPENFDNLMEIIAYIKLLRLYYKLEGRPR